jgi:subtilase family serine protease
MSTHFRTLAFSIAFLGITGCHAGTVSSIPAAQAVTQTVAAVGSPGTAVRVCEAAQETRCGALVRTDIRPSGTPKGYAPADLQAAYNLPSHGNGKGQIVALVDAYDNPNVASDLALYRSTFGLPSVHFTKYNQKGQAGHYPSPNMAWGVQIDLDVEMVSASCPNCTIYLIEANSSSSSDLESAEAEAVTLGAHIVSNGFTGSNLDEKYFETKGVAYLASAGDSGSVGEPAAFPSVVAVGGTTLQRGGGGKRGWTESAWLGSGGCTTFPKPGWQHDKTCAYRLANDVAAVADPSTGVAEYDSYGYAGWLEIGGTSVSSPLLAGVFGLAGNAPEQEGGRTFWLTAHHRYLFQVKSNGKYVRYSTAAGWGTPDGTGAF